MMATDPDPGQRRLTAIAYSASSTLTGPVLVGLLIDWLAGTMPWLTIAGVFVGMAGLFVLLIRFSQPKGPSK
jgi:F0F1-type ATP synthase assembly protein I